MKKIKDLMRKCKYSAESVYIFTELGNKSKARKAMLFHEMKTAIQAGIIIGACQLALYIIISLVK